MKASSRRSCSPPFLLVLALAAAAWPAAALEHFVEARPNNRFAPEELTIQVGDTVTWTNAGGLHNVVADDDSFRCADGCDEDGGNGDPSEAPWTFSLTFETAGTIRYHCQAHEDEAMVGTITVQEGPPPGVLSFSSATYGAGEGDGGVLITVERGEGSGGEVSVQYRTSDISATAGMDYTTTFGTLTWADGDAEPKTFMVPILEDSLDEADEEIRLDLLEPTGGAGLANPSTALLSIEDNDEEETSGTLSFTLSTYQVAEAAGTTVISVERIGGNEGAVSVEYSTAEGTATNGADYTNVSGTLAWADGDSGAKTFEVPIIDDVVIEGVETASLHLTNPTGGAVLGNANALLNILDDDTEVGPCQEDSVTLCLNQGGRFRVQVQWRDPFGNSGQGQAIPLEQRDSGLFYFFEENNVEMLVKVLNACSLPAFQSYWVFYAATTNVEFSLTVTDTVADQQKQYFNPLNMPAAPVQDTRAFRTCP